MELAEAVKKYLEIAGSFGRPIHLSELGLSKEVTQKTVSVWDEDYQISRYLVLTRSNDDALKSFPPEARVYAINGFEYSHVAFHEDIQKLL